MWAKTGLAPKRRLMRTAQDSPFSDEKYLCVFQPCGQSLINTRQRPLELLVAFESEQKEQTDT